MLSGHSTITSCHEGGRITSRDDLVMEGRGVKAMRETSS